MSPNEALLSLAESLLGPLVALLIVWVALRIVVFQLASNDKLFTFRNEGVFKYLMRGETLLKIIYKLKDHYVDQATYDVIPKVGAGNEQQTLVEWIFGAMWIGIVPNQMLIYTILYDRDQRPGDPDNQIGYDLDEEFKIMHRSAQTNFHYFRRVYPIVAREVELADRIKEDITGTITVTTANAYKPVIELKGDWFSNVRAAAEGAINDWARKLNLQEFTDAPKSGADSVLEPEIIATKDGPFGTIATTGMYISSFNFKESRLSKGDPEVEEASRAAKVAMLKGDATRATADATAYEIREIGNARAEAAEKYVTAAGKNALGNRALVAQSISTGMGSHRGTLALGAPGTILSVDSTDRDLPVENNPQANPPQGGNQPNQNQGRSNQGRNPQSGGPTT
jgi:hypothetical protein